MIGNQIDRGAMGKTVNLYHRGWRQVLKPLLRVVVLNVVLGAIMACSPPLQPSLSQPESPPPGVLNSPLMDNRWRIEDVTLQGEEVTFDLFKPMYILFNREGTLKIYSERCGSGTYAIVYLDEQRYRFGDRMFAAEDCGEAIFMNNPTLDCAALVGSEADREACVEAIRRQGELVYDAFEATNEYVLDEEELRLQGETAEMRLVMDNP